MAVYTEDFSPMTVGGQLVLYDWSGGGWYSFTSNYIYAEDTYWSDKRVGFGHAAASWYSYSRWDDITPDADRADSDVVIGVDVPNSASDYRPLMIIVRGSGGHDSEEAPEELIIGPGLAVELAGRVFRRQSHPNRHLWSPRRRRRRKHPGRS